MTTRYVDLIGGLVVAQPSKGWVPKAATGVLAVFHVADKDRPRPGCIAGDRSRRLDSERADRLMEFDELVS